MSTWLIGQSKKRRAFRLACVEICVVAAVLLLASCAGKKVQERQPAPKPVAESPREPVEKEEPKSYPAVLVLGPGLARGFAHAGVLKVLHEEKIPIQAIIGTEMGAVVAAAYASSSTINDFDWAMTQLSPKVFDVKGFSFSDLLGEERDGSRIAKTLGRIFKDRKIEELSIPLRVGVYSEDLNEFLMLERGPISGVVRGAMASRGIYKAHKLGGETIRSAASVRPYPIEEVKAKFNGPVVVVAAINTEMNTLPEGDRKLASEYARADLNSRSLLDKADLVIRPNLNKVGYLDFEKRATAIFRGKKAAQASLDQIRALTGVNSEN